MKNYTFDHFEQLIDMIYTDHSLDVLSIHDHIVEFVIPNANLPVFRLIFNEQAGSIIVSFCVTTSPSVAIQFSNYLKERFKLIELTDEYYENTKGETFVGQEAYVAYEMDLSDNAFQESSNSFTINTKENPVTLILSYPIYPAWDKRAWEIYEDFKKRKQMV